MLLPNRSKIQSPRFLSTKRNRGLRSQSGFTMIEILVVVAIIALLTTIGLLSFTQVNKKARDGKRKSDLEQVRSALVLYRTDNSVYPTSLNWSTMSPIASYLSGSSIRDPLNSPNPQYVFLGTTTTFTICAALESTTPASYCLTQP